MTIATDNIYLIFAVAILIVIREGFQQRDRVEPKKFYSDMWHLQGLVIRLLIFGLVYRLAPESYKIILSVITAVLFWPVYNISCNIGMRRKWYYLSNKGIDKVIRKVLFFINFYK